MPLSPTDSSEETSLLENGGRIGINNGSLTQPFVNSSYNGSGRAAPAATPAGATATARQPATEDLRRNAVAEQPEVPEAPRVPLSGRYLLLVSFLFVFGYLAAGVIVYTWLSGMDVLDALYFCVVTLTTVGYGDLSAHKPVTKLFACFYILVGVAMIAAFLSRLVELALDKQEDLLVNFLEKTKATGSTPTTETSAQGDNALASANGAVGEGSVEDDDNNSIRRSYVEVGLGVFYFFLLVVAGTIMFKVAGHMSFIDAFYLTVVSASTVGYGDYSPTTHVERMFAIFFLPLSTLLLGKVISDYTEMRSCQNAKRRQTRILMATVTAQEYKAMDTDGDNRVSPLEYMCRTLVRQEKVTQEEVDVIQSRFTALDRDDSGFVTWDEIGEERDRDGDGFINADEL